MSIQHEELINETTRRYGEPRNVVLYGNGNIQNIVWVINAGAKHASHEITFGEDGCIRNNKWKMGGDYHRDCNDEPATITYNELGEIRSEQWSIHGELHRGGDLPAIIKYGPGPNGTRIVVEEHYYFNGRKHRLDAPAGISYRYHNGVHVVNYEKYYNDGYIHRTNGPARITYHEHGESTEEWFISGNAVSLELVMIILNNIPLADAVELKLKYGG